MSPGVGGMAAGVYAYGYDASLNVKNSFPVFSTHIEANYVSKREVGLTRARGSAKTLFKHGCLPSRPTQETQTCEAYMI